MSKIRELRYCMIKKSEETVICFLRFFVADIIDLQLHVRLIQSASNLK